MTNVDLDILENTIIYNQTDLGELGMFIRVEYVLNFINDLRSKDD